MTTLNPGIKLVWVEIPVKWGHATALVASNELTPQGNKLMFAVSTPDDPKYYPAHRRKAADKIVSLMKFDEIAPWSPLLMEALDISTIKELQYSIAQVNMIEPLPVDLRGRLLTGRYRYAGLQRVRSENRSRYDELCPDDMVPVIIQPFDAEEDPTAAVTIVMSENVVRRGDSYEDFKRYFRLLAHAGVKLDSRGRPAHGTPESIRSHVCRILEISDRQFRRHLARMRAIENPKPPKAVDRVKTLQGAIKKLSAKDLAALKAWIETYERNPGELRRGVMTISEGDITTAVLEADDGMDDGSADLGGSHLRSAEVEADD